MQVLEMRKVLKIHFGNRKHSMYFLKEFKKYRKSGLGILF